MAAKQALEAKDLKPKRVNVFTRGPHARRTRLVYSKTLGPATQVGIISWNPYGPMSGGWWHSSSRAEELLKETVGYLYEVFLSSGRWLAIDVRRPQNHHGDTTNSPSVP
jgi:hypothetical protein